MSTLDEEKMAKMIKLPEFLLSIHDLDQVQDPPLKNFKYQQISQKINSTEVFKMFSKEDLIKRKREKIRPLKDQCCTPKGLLKLMVLFLLLSALSYFIIFDFIQSNFDFTWN